MNESPLPPADGSDTLTLRLKRKWFDLIALGYKQMEFRTASSYWKSRIENDKYNKIFFRNGYGKQRPSMLVEYRQWNLDDTGNQ